MLAAFTPSSNVAMSAIKIMSGYLALISAIKSLIVVPSKRGRKVQSKAIISQPVSTRASTSFIVAVMNCDIPS